MSPTDAKHSPLYDGVHDRWGGGWRLEHFIKFYEENTKAFVGGKREGVYDETGWMK